MPSASVPMAAMVGGTALSAAGQISSGNAAAAAGQSEQQASDYSALVLTQQAGQVRAVSQAKAINSNLQTAYVQSTVRARAAASGGSATDPTVVNLQGQIGARGQYSALAALYTGEEEARGDENKASLDIFTGQQQLAAGQAKQTAGYIGAFASVLSGAGSIGAKYGGTGGSGGAGHDPSLDS